MQHNFHQKNYLVQVVVSGVLTVLVGLFHLVDVLCMAEGVQRLSCEVFGRIVQQL